MVHREPDRLLNDEREEGKEEAADKVPQSLCIFGSRGDAHANRDADENVVQIEYRVVKVEG